MLFISYSHRDSDRVHPLIKRLISEGYDVWYDEGIDPGTEWDENIAMHLKQCSGIIAFISENYVESENCRDELNYARDLGKERLLIYLENVELPAGMAMRLNRIQAIHKYKYKSDDAFYREFTKAPMLKKAEEAQETPKDDSAEDELFPVTKREFLRKSKHRTISTVILIFVVASLVLAPFMCYLGDYFLFPVIMILVGLGFWKLDYRFIIPAAVLSLLYGLLFMPMYFVLVIFLAGLTYSLFKADRSYRQYLSSGKPSA